MRILRKYIIAISNMIPIEMDDFKSYEDFKMYFDENIMALTSQKCDCRGLD